MKQFNLKEYLKDPSKKVVTRDGKDVRIICTDKKGYSCIVALVSDGKDEEKAFTYYSDGTRQTYVNSSTDLCFAPTKHEGWVNISVFLHPRQEQMEAYTILMKKRRAS